MTYDDYTAELQRANAQLKQRVGELERLLARTEPYIHNAEEYVEADELLDAVRAALRQGGGGSDG